MPLPRLDTWDDVADHLRYRRSAAGDPTFRDLALQVRDLRISRGMSAADAPGRTTIFDCFKDGRRRMDLDLIVDLGHVLGMERAELREWDAACFAVQNRVDSAKVVSVTEVAHRVDGFVGRTAEIERIHNTPGLWCISGLPGVGKSQLALHLADLWVAEGHADRVVIADLRGYHRERAAADGDAMRIELLRTLCGTAITDPDAARARLADELAAQRCVLVLDDAASTDQVTALIGASPQTPVLVTSRSDLAIDVEPDAASQLQLGPLSIEESVAVLSNHCRDATIEGDLETAGRIATSLGGHPLALDVTGRRIAATPRWSLRDHEAALAEQADLLRLPDVLTSAFALSYQRLGAEAQLLLRLLAIQPGRSYGRNALQALSDLADPDQAVSELVTANLAIRSNDRVELHDLIRTYAAAAAIHDEPPTQRDAARARLLRYYLGRSGEAVVATGLEPNVGRRFFEPPLSSMTREQAVSWLAEERENLLALADPRMCAPMPDYPLQLSRILVRALDVSGHHRAGGHLHNLALQYAQRAGDRVGEAQAEANLGHALNRIDPDAAGSHTRRALQLVNRDEDPETHASAHASLGAHAAGAGDFTAAEEHTRAALETVQTYATTRKPGPLIGNLAVILYNKGDLDGAAKQHAIARDACLAAGDIEAAATAWSNLSSVYYDQQKYTQAKEAAAQGAQLAESIGSRLSYAACRANLGNALTKLGELDEAREVLESVLRDVREVGHHYLEAAIQLMLGRALAAAGDVEEARVSYLAGSLVAERYGFEVWATKHQDALAELPDPVSERS